MKELLTKESVLALMKLDYTQEQIAKELKCFKYEVGLIQKELLSDGHFLGKTKASLLYINKMEAEVFELAENWDCTLVDPDKNKRYNELLYKLEQIRI